LEPKKLDLRREIRMITTYPMKKENGGMSLRWILIDVKGKGHASPVIFMVIWPRLHRKMVFMSSKGSGPAKVDRLGNEIQQPVPPLSHRDIRSRAATLALVTTFFLTVGKLAAGYLTNSVGVVSEGIHSSLDLVSAIVAFFTIREAIKPADSDHPFGHGKIETLSSLLEAFLLVAAAVYIFFEAYEGFKHPREVQQAGIAMVTIAISLVVSYAVYRQNHRAALATDSRAIEVNALHFLADAMTSLGVLIALLFIYFTGKLWIDPLVAGLVGIYILVISWGQIKGSIQELTDQTLPMEEVRHIESILARFSPRAIGTHDLRTRKSGASRQIEFHLSLCGKWSVNDSHELCDEMEADLLAFFPAARVTIHVEPCGHHPRPTKLPCELSPQALCEYQLDVKREGS
jgi:cation diffusion facilitator family transporter